MHAYKQNLKLSPKVLCAQRYIFRNEKSTNLLIVVKSDLYFLPSLRSERTSVNFELTFKWRHIDFIVYTSEF